MEQGWRDCTWFSSLAQEPSHAISLMGAETITNGNRQSRPTQGTKYPEVAESGRSAAGPPS